MYFVILEEKPDRTLYLISRGRVRLWEEIEEISAYMHFYDMGCKSTKEIGEATIFSSLEQIDELLNMYSTKELYPNARAVEIQAL